MEKTKTILKAIAGLIALPIVLAMFTADRIILIFLPHVTGNSFLDVLKDLNKLTPMFYRLITVLALYGLYCLF